ncbi:MAG: transporter substrate-binding domain-containing protein [Gammaproteobacteria bacterium]|nr:transporter substrate-binding domain-containing protein [Gammaproteobacteria bacterium]
MKARVAIFIAIAVITALLFVGLGVRKSDLAPNWLAAPLSPPRVSGELVVLTLRGPTTAHVLPKSSTSDADIESGFEHDLATLFAKELGVTLNFKVVSSYSGLLQMLNANRAHLAAAGLSPSAELRQQFAFSPSYKTIQYQLIYRTKDTRPKNTATLGNRKIAVIAETPAHDIARDLTGNNPTLAIVVLPHEATAEDLLVALDSNRADVALIDANAFAISRRLHPELSSAFNVGRESKVAWAFSNIADYDLQQSSVKFLKKFVQTAC